MKKTTTTQGLSKTFSALEEIGVVVNRPSLSKHEYQGFMSTVYSVESDQGELIIHAVERGKEWSRQRVWEKLDGVSKLLERYPGIPAPKLILSEKVGDIYFLVQKKLPGEPAGKRLLIKDKIVDKWSGKKSKHVTDVQKILARVHKIARKGYGWPAVADGGLKGQHAGWQKFFEKEVPIWLRSLRKGDARIRDNKEMRDFRRKAGGFFRDEMKKIPAIFPVLIHGDAINPSNILVRNGGITGLLDWEWSMIGDPAWEFCDPGWWPYLNEKSMKPYFEEMGYSKLKAGALLKRTRLYRPFWLLWGAHIHAEDKNMSIYKVLRKMLAQEVPVN
jgi:hypothetical protein